MRKKLFTFLLALAASVGMMYAATDGKLSGAFSVASGTQVYFSQGNLQYQASTNTWRFAEHQYDFIGDAAGNTTVSGRDTQSDWIDLFGWATSGNSASGTAYQPWTNSAVHSEYGPAITSGDWTYANSDWGINPISNGGNTASSWRTLSQEEWHYLLFDREGNRFAYASLNIGGNYIYGLIILPDDWNTSYYALGSINETNHSYDSNQITAENWTNSLEAHGAVFLPITGSRNVDQISGIDGENSTGLYWSSTAGEYYEEIENEFEPEQPIVIDIKNAAYALQFAGGYFIRNNVTRRATGVAVRLVAETSGGSSEPEEPVVSGYTVSLDIAENADKVTLSAASAVEGATVTLTPAEGYQITSFTATSGSGNSAVRFTSDPNESVNDAEPQYVALPHEFTADVIPGNYGASFVDIEGGEGQIEYVGMNSEGDQLTFRVNGTFSGTAAVHYQYKEGGWKISAIRVICAAEGGGSEVQSVKDDVTGAYSFTMPAGNVTVTATVEAIPTSANSCGDGLTWELSEGVLTISYDGVGTGVMDDWGGYNETPWSSEKLQITSVMLPEGITTIGSAAFRGCTNLASVNMAENFPASLTTIKTEAFYNSALTSVTIPANVVSIYSNVFYECQSIANVYCYANPNDLVWMDGYCDDFKSGNKITQCHVKNCYLSLYNTKWNTGYELTDVNVTFVGDLPGDCGSSTFIDADFAINFMNDPYIVVGGSDLPEGVLVEGIPNKDLNHGYYNVIITIPAKAGTYKVTLGTCGFGLGNGTIKNENGSTTYASFNQHLADNDLCYHQDPTNNIVTAIFTLPEDQNIIVDCGEYTPYFSIEASSAPTPTYLDADFAIDFRTDPYTVVGGGALPDGVEVAGSMNTGDAAHGYSSPIITIPVKAGNYKVMMGACSYSGVNGTVQNEDGTETYATLATNLGENKCYHQNTATNVVSEIFNVPTDQVIKVHGAQYTPYFAIEKMAAVPAFTDFEINFQSDPYNVISGAKPEGTVIAGSFHDGQHGYQNVEATVPMQAGTYRLTLGACGYGNGAGNVISETNVELASFNQKLAEESMCYVASTGANTVSVIFTVDMDQTITIDCGQYTPYMKLEKISAYAVEFALGDAEGIAPAAADVTIGEAITMPVNKTMYKEGYTLTGWSDGVNTYAIGEPFTPTSDAVLTPVFTENAENALQGTTARWYFGTDNGAPEMHIEGNNGFLIAQATNGNKTVDVKLSIDATSGKFKNTDVGDARWAQVNANTVLTFPSAEDATVNVWVMNEPTESTLDGNAKTGWENNIATYDAAPTAGTSNYAVQGSATWYGYIEITYPAPTAVVIGDPNDADQVNAFLTTYNEQLVPDLTIDRPVLNNMYNTLCLPFHMDADQIAASSLNGVEIYEFVDVDVTNDELYLYTSEQKHEIVAGRPYLVKFSAASQLSELNFIDVVINNADLDDQAVTIKGVTFKGTFQPIVLGAQTELNFNGGHLFLMANNTLVWPNSNNPLKPFRAYFTVNVDAGQSAGMPVRRGMAAHIGGPAQIPTGVDQISQEPKANSQKLMENGVLYIIKNGVKYNAQGQIVK